MRFSVAHPNASNVFKATFVLQCCIDGEALAPHCNALQRRHWRAMPDTLTHSARHRGTSSAALPRSRAGWAGQCSRQRGAGRRHCSGLAANCRKRRAPKEAPREAMKNKKKKKKKKRFGSVIDIAPALQLAA